MFIQARYPMPIAVGLFMISVCLGTAVATGQASEPAATQPAGELEPTPVYRADDTMFIDGVLNEDVWQKAHTVNADYVFGQVGQLADTPAMWAKFAWDRHYLYIGYRVYDEHLVAHGSEHLEGPVSNQRRGAENWLSGPKWRRLKQHGMGWNAEVAEFFLVTHSQDFFWEIHQNAANHFNDVFVVRFQDNWDVTESTINERNDELKGRGHRMFQQASIRDDGQYRLARAVRMAPKADGNPSTINDNRDTDSGYFGEIRIPWLDLGPHVSRRNLIEIPPEDPNGRPTYLPGPWDIAGMKMQILAVYQDNQRRPRYYHSSPTKPGGWFHHGGEHYPPFIMVDDREDRPEPNTPDSE